MSTLPISIYVYTYKKLSLLRKVIFIQLGSVTRGPLSLVNTTEELLDRKVAAPA
jgi:hypothetical protein